jgi:DNA-binding MarR family transcriptional regulator
MNRSLYERLHSASNFFKLPASFMKSPKQRPTGAAFLLAQLGAHAADRFGERIKRLHLAPRHAGILRIIATTPSCNQRALAKRLGVLPSRIVILIDELAEKGLVERKRSTKDRRHSELVLTKRGGAMLEKLSKLAAEHEADLCASLTTAERDTLAALGRKIVHQQGLTPDVHPGYRKL